MSTFVLDPFDDALVQLDLRQVVELAVDWAEAALPVWEAQHREDHRSRRAVEAARAWLACACPEHVLAAGAAADDVDEVIAYAAFPRTLDDVDATSVADFAVGATSDAAHAAYGAGAGDPTVLSIASGVGRQAERAGAPVAFWLDVLGLLWLDADVRTIEVAAGFAEGGWALGFDELLIAARRLARAQR